MIKFTCALLLAASSLFASTFSYDLAVNTASLPGTGTLYFQFNPGDVSSDPATASIINFQIAGAGNLMGTTTVSGGGSGTLPLSLAIANSGANNDALQALKFGSSLLFRILITENFTGTATTGSVLNFGVFQADGVTPLLTTDPDGFAVKVNLNNINGSSAATTTAFATVTPVANAVPEPATVVLLCAGFAGIFAVRRFVKR